MKITDEILEYVSILAKLSLNEEEKAKITKGMNEMLDHIEALNAVDTDQVEPVSHLFPLENLQSIGRY